MQKTNNINDLRKELFETINLLKGGKIEVKTAQTISNLSKNIIETAKVELSFLKHTEQTKSDFLLDPENKRNLEIEAKKLLPENAKYFNQEKR